MEGGGHGSPDHRIHLNVGGNGGVGHLLLVDVPYLCPARCLAHGAPGVGTDTADILREVHPDVGEIKEHVIEAQETKINEIAERVTQVAETIVSPNTATRPAPKTHPTTSPWEG